MSPVVLGIQGVRVSFSPEMACRERPPRSLDGEGRCTATAKARGIRA